MIIHDSLGTGSIDRRPAVSKGQTTKSTVAIFLEAKTEKEKKHKASHPWKSSMFITFDRHTNPEEIISSRMRCVVCIA